MSGSGDIRLPINIRGGRARVGGGLLDPLFGLLNAAGSIARIYDAYQNSVERAETRQRLDQLNERNRRLRENYDRLDTQMNANQRQVREEIKRQARQQKEDLEKSAARLREEHKRDLEKTVKGFDQRIKMAEERFDDRFDNLEEQIEAEFASQKIAFEKQLQEHHKFFEHALSQQKIDLQSQINDLKKRVENAQINSRDWLELAQSEIAFIADNLPHDFFAPGQLQLIGERVKIAAGNFNNGNYEAALAVSQESFVQAVNLRQNIEKQLQEWEIWRSLCLEETELLLTTMRSFQRFRLEDLEISENGEAIRHEDCVEVDTDYWVAGAYVSMIAEVEKRIELLKNPQYYGSLDEVRQMRKETAEGLNQVPVLVARAKYAVIAFNLRAEIQAKFAERMGESGYSIVGNVCEGDDQRCANHLILSGPNGEKLTISLVPDVKNGELANLVEFHFNDKSCNRSEREEKVNIIIDELRKAYDLPDETLKYRCKEGTDWKTNASEEMFDPERLLKKKTGHE